MDMNLLLLKVEFLEQRLADVVDALTDVRRTLLSYDFEEAVTVKSEVRPGEVREYFEDPLQENDKPESLQEIEIEQAQVEENEKLQDIAFVGLNNGQQNLSRLYKENFHICNTKFGLKRGEGDCFHCLTLLRKSTSDVSRLTLRQRENL